MRTSELSPTPRPPPGRDRFLDLELPERFVLQFETPDGTWMDEAVCLQRQFVRNADGSYLCTSSSSALWIRCVAHRLEIRCDKVERRIEISATVSEAVAQAFENAKDLPEEVSSVTTRDIAGAGFEPATFGL